MDSTQDTDTLAEYSVFYPWIPWPMIYLPGRFPLCKRHSGQNEIFFWSWKTHGNTSLQPGIYATMLVCRLAINSNRGAGSRKDILAARPECRRGYCNRRITSYNVCYTKLLRLYVQLLDSNIRLFFHRLTMLYDKTIDQDDYWYSSNRITSYNVCYTKLLRQRLYRIIA